MGDNISKVMDKVRALFAKADSTDYEAEAEVFASKAQELLTRYALDRAEVMAGGNTDTVTIQAVGVPGPYRKARATLLSGIARANGCFVVGVGGTNWSMVRIAGTEHNVEATKMVWQSVMTQGDRLVLAATPVGSARSFRSSWWYAFATRVGDRLDKTQKDVAGGLLPVLVSERERAEAAMREQVRVGSASRPQARSAAGYSAGASAASTVNVGASSVGGGRRALGR